jgi:rhamnose transport system substrate-binding protein
MLFHMKRKGAVRVLALAAGVAALAMVTAGCSSTSGSGSTTAKNYKITFLPKNLGNNYFEASDQIGGKAAVKSFKGTWAEVGPATGTPSAQVSYINTLTQQKVGAIILSADDPNAPCNALKQASRSSRSTQT